MDVKKWIATLGFIPKENTVNTYRKQYLLHGGYSIDVDFGKEEIIYNEIVSDSKTTRNFSQPENFIVLECVDRLLSKGYKPQNIILEKVWRSGHGTSGRLDICVTRDDGSPYLLIECKTCGKEFDKELSKTHKDGGQLFTYFQLSGCKADIIMLYTSELKSKEFVHKNEIIKIEDEYRSGEVKDIYEKWNKLTKDNGIFDSWVKPYNFQSKALTKEQLKAIRPEDSSFIFNRFLEILRHNVVSDKGNAFNKIFTLFLCKVYDETSTVDGEELQFQWKEGVDNHVDFQLRLTELYGKGMQKFLGRTVSDFNEDDFNKRCANLNEDTKKYLLQEVNKLRLEKNNEFAIKEVYDTPSFEENARVVKEVVELIQGYKIRYNKRQQYLSDFFELLLTTGLKQEASQFFTPVPVAQFIIKSLPLDTIVEERLKQKDGEILPYMIDYAAGSGHFLTEYMHEVQGIITQSQHKDYIDATARKIKNWQADHFDWATQYVYGVEKDYRLVKVGKVGCYLHGDGLANVILSDGLANFSKNKEYKGKLRKEAKETSKDNQQFDLLLSNPPYSVSSFRQTTRDYYTENDFELYSSLTDNSSEIECLFVERAKQLLKDGGVAGVILPSSILSNAGIYAKTREIILQYFDIVAITELGSNTFMATGTNTVVLFLRRRNNYDSKNICEAAERYFKTLNDVTVNGIEMPVAKYVAHVWEKLDYADYVTLLQKTPNEKVKAHELYAGYRKKIKAKDETKFWQELFALECEKLTCFIIAYPQKVVLVKSGEKDAEKRFLGYEFSNRRGNEGIHPIQRGKNIEECTQLFDACTYNNPNKASTYIYRAFKGDYDSAIAESMQKNVFRTRLVDMLTFDRTDFEKTIATAIKKKVTAESESKWELRKLGEICNLYQPKTITSQEIKNDGKYKVFGANGVIGYYNEYNHEEPEIAVTCRGATCGTVNYTEPKSWITGNAMVVKPINETINKRFLFHLLSFSDLSETVMGTAQPQITRTTLEPYKIPLPPIEIQQQIVAEIETLEKIETEAKERVEKGKEEIEQIYANAHNSANATYRLSNDDIFEVSIGKRVIGQDLTGKGAIPVYSANVFEPFGYIDKYLITNFSIPSVLWGIDGDWMVNYIPADKPFYPTDHCGVLRVKTDEILPKYLAWVLNKEGVAQNFSRTLRASIDRIKGITVKAPPLSFQRQIVAEIEEIEVQIAEAQKIIAGMPELKNEVLKKYL